MKPSVFLSGIGGIGMANVAVLLKQLGYDVSGSDGQVYEPAATILRDAQIPVKSPYAAENLPRDGSPLIIGNAHSRGHVEVEAALDESLPMYSFPEFLGRHVLPGRHSIVVAGTHGKSTTTSCLAHLLQSAGDEPGFLVGALPLNFPEGGRAGRGKAFVLEGDEYDSAFFDKRSKFLHYFPRTLVLGTVEFDHADIFANLDEMLLAFRRLINLLPRSGRLVFAAECEATRQLTANAPCPVISVGLDESCDWQLLPDIQMLAFRDPTGTTHRLSFELPGRHNRMNALMALAGAMAFQENLSEYLSGLASFRGLKRRMEKLHDRHGMTVYDDFAHHPTAIASAIQAVREQHPHAHLTVICEPRSNTMVRNIFQRELTHAFAGADRVIFGTIHRQDRIPADQRLDLQSIIRHIQTTGARAEQIDNPQIVETLANEERPSPSVFLFLSNGCFDGVPHEYVSRLKSKQLTKLST